MQRRVGGHRRRLHDVICVSLFVAVVFLYVRLAPMHAGLRSKSHSNSIRHDAGALVVPYHGDNSIWQHHAASLVALNGSKILLSPQALDTEVVLVVNVASHCGFTEMNYRELERMYRDLHRRGLRILAFPCNQFGEQESDPPGKILQFVKQSYAVTFDMMEKVVVNGIDAHPLFVDLKRERHVGSIDWNFWKFLIGRGGRVLKAYDTRFPMELLRHDVEMALTRGEGATPSPHVVVG